MLTNFNTVVNQSRKFSQLQKIIEIHLDALLPIRQKPDLINTAMRASTLAPGKRIRPLLLILAARDMGCKVQEKSILNLACAVEMVHTASLILDDIPSMDNALIRRGRPTIHREFGENIAILAVIALLSRAFEVIANTPNVKSIQKSNAIAELSSAVGLQGLVQGQFQDLQNDILQNHNIETITLTNDLKTSMLFRATLQIAAIASDATQQMRQKLINFSQNLGQAFQLLDDISDYYKYIGKDSHQDQSKLTLVRILGIDGAKCRLNTHLKNAEIYLTGVCKYGISTRQYMYSIFYQQLSMFN
ncbi:polyprenyl synthetase family protein [Pantoea sp. Aalb]|uniref:polyprenyl synthetase family protein n=1 Tax=Pantoea sp. Aalb TaxID=2576762 RepID=UPI00132C0426|nr:polyprenyl synthetase family protein [Pantoea sp. Aalb]MXP67990.1 polyprenyl synthetase family protein [Pantoea sp. Aalb]